MMRLARGTALAALALVFAGAALCAPPGAKELERKLDAHLSSYSKAGYFSGTLLVARGDRVLYEKSFGWANRELEVPFTPTTRCNVASVTKPMTIALACRLVDAGKLAPSDSIARWLPDFPRAHEITVSHLLNHRAGIPHRVTTELEETVPRTAADMVELVKQAEFLSAPGEERVYSSAGYSVLARVLELAGGGSYQELLEKHLFAPAGMTHSAHVDGAELLEGRATSYLIRADGLSNAPLQDLSFLVGAGSVYSTARDLYRMMRAVNSGTLGETAKGALLRENGLSWNGSTSGFRAFADWHKESDLYVVVTSNLQSGANDLLREAAPKLAAGEEVAPPEVPRLEPAAVAEAVLKRYEGNFQLRPGSNVDVRVGNQGLYVGSWYLIPTSDTTFFSPQDFGKVGVVFENGEVSGFRWDHPTGSIDMPKLGPRAVASE